MSHLDDWAAALVDAELSAAERDRALAHLAGCDPCRAEVDRQRQVKARLAPGPVSAVPAALAARLLAIPAGASDAPARSGDVVRRSAAASSRPWGTRPWSRRADRPVPARRRSATRMALNSAGLVAAAMAVAVLAGGEAPGQVRPPVGTYVVEHTATTTQLPLNDMAADIVMISTR
jgi:anti-sigma factor RsiW